MCKLKEALRLKIGTEYAQWLHQRRKLAAETIFNYAAQAGRFLSWNGERKADCPLSDVAICVSGRVRSRSRAQALSKIKLTRVAQNNRFHSWWRR